MIRNKDQSQNTKLRVVMQTRTPGHSCSIQ